MLICDQLPWMAHGVGTELPLMVLMSPDELLEQVAKGHFQLGTVIELDIGVDDGHGLPLASHGVQVATHAYVGAEVLAETDVGIAAVGGAVDVGTHGRVYHHLLGIVVAEGVQGNVGAEVVSHGAAKTVLCGEHVLPGHPILVDVARSGEMPSPHVLLQYHAPCLGSHHARHLTRGAVETHCRPLPESKPRCTLLGQLGIALYGRILWGGKSRGGDVLLKAQGVGLQLRVQVDGVDGIRSTQLFAAVTLRLCSHLHGKHNTQQ